MIWIAGSVRAIKIYWVKWAGNLKILGCFLLPYECLHLICSDTELFRRVRGTFLQLNATENHYVETRELIDFLGANKMKCK